MGRLGKLRAFFDAPLRYFWIYLAIPTLVSFDTHGSWRDYPVAWLVTFVLAVCVALPMHLSYAHLFERLAGPDPLSLRALPFHAVVVFGWALLGVEIGGLLVSALLPPNDLEHRKEVMRFASLFGAPLLVAGIIAYERYHERLAEIRTREIRAQREALAAQVQALQARLQPHFLFNSLNAVASLIGEDSKRAETAVERLSDLLRYALDASKQPFVPLADELDAVEGFLELEMLRFPDRLEASVRVEPGIGAVPVPPLVLQPLVENAVQHGIAPRREGGRVELEIQRAGDELRVRVEDDGPGPGASTHRGSGSALDDLRERLGLLYGERASLGVDRGALGGYRVTLRLPLRGAEPADGEDAT